MNTLKGAFCYPKSSKRNFIQENVRQLREMTNYWNNKEAGEAMVQHSGKTHKYSTISSKVPPHVMGTKMVTAKKSPELNNLKGKNQNTRMQGKNLTGSKSSPANKATTGKGVPKLPRKSRIGIRNKPDTTERNLRISDVAEYVRRQRETVLNNENELLDSEGSLSDSDSDSIHYIKSPVPVNHKSQSKAHKSTACQTIDAERMDSLYDEGIIRYPSASKCGSKTVVANKKISFRNMSQQTERSEPSANKLLPNRRQNIPFSAPLNAKPEKHKPNEEDLKFDVNKNFQPGGADYVRMNARAASAAPVKMQATHEADRLKVPSTYQKGIVPRYLQKRQTQWQKEEEQKQLEGPDPNCPPGHVPLPENERKETLKVLRKSYADFVHELNMLPVRADTLRVRQRKMELEKQLNKLEEGIKVFSRPKVFVKIGA